LNQKYEIIIERKGKYPAPVSLLITYSDQSTERIEKSVSVWSQGQKQYKLSLPMTRRIKSVELSDPLIPDADASNDYYEIEH
jgi:hypothetical protein